MNSRATRGEEVEKREGSQKKMQKKDREIIIALFAGVHCAATLVAKEGKKKKTSQGENGQRNGRNRREARVEKEQRWRSLNRTTRVKGRTSGTNIERKPSLIKDKGISATSRLLVTTTSASHSLQRPLSEKPSFHPPSSSSRLRPLRAIPCPLTHNYYPLVDPSAIRQ